MCIRQCDDPYGAFYDSEGTCELHKQEQRDTCVHEGLLFC